MKARSNGGNGSGGPGSQRIRDRLYKLGEKAYKDADHKYHATSELLLTAMLTDEHSTDLLWELLHPYYPQKFSTLFAEIARRHHHKSDAPKPGAAKTAAATPTQRKSRVRNGESLKGMKEVLLRTKMIQLVDGTWQALFDSTREQGLAWAERQPAEAQAVKLLAHPMPPGARFGHYYPDSTDDEVRKIYDLAKGQMP